MSVSSESAEQFIRLYLDGMEFALKITGSATQNIMGILYAISKERKINKENLKRMLTEDKSIKFFEIKKSDMKIFAKEAKNYGVNYTLVKNKTKSNTNDKNELVDIMIMEKDAPKVNRIVTRFNLTTTEKGKIEKEGEKRIEDIQKEQVAEQIQETEVAPPKVDDAMIDDIFGEVNAEEKKQENMQSPSQSQTEQTKESQLENSSMQKTQLDGETKNTNKPSVKEDLKKCAEEVKAEEKIRKAEKNVIPIKAGKPKSKERSK